MTALTPRAGYAVTALTPRAGYAVSERISVWGALGYGAGELTLTPKDQPARKTDIAMTLPAIGARGTLVDGDGAGDHGECHRVRRKWRQPGVPGAWVSRARGRDTGFGASIAWDEAPSPKRGLSLSLRQSVGGAATGGKDALFSREVLTQTGLRTEGSGVADMRAERFVPGPERERS